MSEWTTSSDPDMCDHTYLSFDLREGWYVCSTCGEENCDPWPCEYGHYDCSTRDLGPCSDEHRYEMEDEL
jgi:hypothetical protein